MRAPLLLLNEAAVWPAYPPDACGVAKHKDGAADVHVGVEREPADAFNLTTRHDRFYGFGFGKP